MSIASPVRVGVIGLGFIGRIHLSCYRAAAERGECRLAAVCDVDPARRAARAEVSGNIAQASAAAALLDPTTRIHATADELLQARDIDAISVCTHTDTHVDLAIRALQAGKHVLVEKPVSLRAADVQRLIDAREEIRAAKGTTPLCMPAMCMRFWPGWSWLKQRIEDGRFGPVRSAMFQRLASMPAWSSFYTDRARSGGALFDLHIHDADFVRHCFGEPNSLVSAGSIDHVTTLYCFSNGPPHVVAEGGWDHAAGFPFRMRFAVVFEQATAEFDSRFDSPLMLSGDGRCEPVPLEPTTGYDQQVRYFLNALRSGATETAVTLNDALGVTKMLELELRSLGAR